MLVIQYEVRLPFSVEKWKQNIFFKNFCSKICEFLQSLLTTVCLLFTLFHINAKMDPFQRHFFMIACKIIFKNALKSINTEKQRQLFCFTGHIIDTEI